MVGYDEADVGATFISYTSERNEFVSYTHPVGLDDIQWVSKYPGQKSPMTNIVKVFDIYTWIGLLISTGIASLVLIGVVHILRHLGLKQPDSIAVALMPLSLLNAEPMPNWFLVSSKRIYSGSILLVVWALCSAVITYAFSSNLRAIVLSPSYETPIDTAQQIVENNLIPIVGTQELVYTFLNFSTNPWFVKVAQLAIPPTSTDEKFDAILAGTSVTSNTQDLLLNYISQDPTLSRLNKLKPPIFYFSKERIRFYYVGWMVQKNSKWRIHLDNHILLCDQAGFYLKIKRTMINTAVSEHTISDREKMRVEHIAVAFMLLGIGYIISTLGMFFL
ncbi:uncharacterized protein LOC111699649 [Eurytemora carolleeae]|uniref:uncharacterized protein LOC111699649 n=1 Tax=Eurytemora carolleeae TaxID=1294199 RepID=UPI000C77BB73|nr:uncharacterized protein LOC111699649 [Eurytemora carolleeae]|eukprot:XP_023326141.1 uncharacterized protein LOC111699649 [Eurytemora affinis]